MKFKKYNNLIFSFILIAIFFFFASLLPVYAQGVGKDTSNQDEIKQEELSIKLKALQVANEIDKYLKDHPNLTLKQLQEDNDFKNIAVQKVGENGYTGVIDSQSGYFYFHPQEKLINTDSHSLKEKLPDFWKIFSRTIGEECREASGHYKWLEADSKETEKYLYTACVERATADGKKLFVGATAYINETTAKKYLNKYDIKNSFYYSQRFIKQRSFDIAKQVELYIKANPKKTLEDFKNDSIFRELAIQRVGESGYTYLVNHKNGSMDFHPDPKIEGKSYNAFKDKFPIIWNMIDSSIQANPCADSEGFYKWADIEGKIRDKYTYHHCIDAQTADGYSFFLGASTYLDEYKDIQEDSPGGDQKPDVVDQKKQLNSNILSNENIEKYNSSNKTGEVSENEINSFILVYWIIAFILLMFLILFILNYFHIIKIGEKFIVFLLGGTSLILIILFIFSAYQVARNMKKNNLDTYGSQQMFLAEQAVKNTENNLEFLINNIQVNAENYNFLAEDKIKNHAYLENLFKISNKYVESINLLDSQGILLDEVYSQEAKLYPHNSKDFSKKPGVAELIKNRKLKISDIFKNHLEKGMLSILIPINHQDTLKGILRVNILLSTIFKNNFDSLMDSRIKMLRLFTKNDSYMFDGSASNIPAPMLKIINKKEAYNFLDLAHDPALANKYSGEFLKTNYPLEIGGNHWNLILATPVKNIYSSIVQDVNRIWYFTISIIIAIILIVFIFNFILSKSFKKQIFNKTKEIADSNRIISEQLKKEEQSRKEKENLIKNQKKVQEELEEKLDELSKFQKVTIDRELKMIELKEKLKNIKNKKT